MDGTTRTVAVAAATLGLLGAMGTATQAAGAGSPEPTPLFERLLKSPGAALPQPAIRPAPKVDRPASVTVKLRDAGAQAAEHLVVWFVGSRTCLRGG